MIANSSETDGNVAASNCPVVIDLRRLGLEMRAQLKKLCPKMKQTRDLLVMTAAFIGIPNRIIIRIDMLQNIHIHSILRVYERQSRY